jgi:hypothetical protein
MGRRNLKLKSPLYCGFSILDLSKLYMFTFYYEYLKPKYGDKMRLLSTDTDSFILEIYTEDLYQDIKQDLDHFDTSDYPPDHELYSSKNKKVLGKYKDELNSKVLKEFVGLSPKLYSLKVHDSKVEEKKVGKGIPRHLLRDRLRHQDYVNCLHSKTYRRPMSSHRIQSKNHQISTVVQEKQTLSSLDTKRYLHVDPALDSLPFGHYRIQKKQDGRSHSNVSVACEKTSDSEPPSASDY